MKKYGFFRVASAVPTVKPGNVEYNCAGMAEMVRKAASESAELVVFPELSISGYTSADLFYQEILLRKSMEGLVNIAETTGGFDTAIAVGLPCVFEGRLYNCAALVQHGRILGIVPKIHIPNYNEFYEKRWFTPGFDYADTHASLKINGRDIPFGAGQIFNVNGVGVGLEICEDLWVPAPPSCGMAQRGADIIANLSATPEQTGKHSYLLSLIRQQSARCRCGYVYSSAGAMESSTDLAISGNAIIAENGSIVASGKRFNPEPQIVFADIDVEMLRNDRIKYSTFADGTKPGEGAPVESTVHINGHDTTVSIEDSLENLRFRHIVPMPFVPSNPKALQETCSEIVSIQAWGLAQRLKTIGCRSAVIGISGGLDSTLALLVTVRAFDNLGIPRSGITGITMPGFGTTVRTRGNAWKLMEKLGVTPLEISINNAVNLHFEDIGQDKSVHDATYENSQARERTQILMDMANKTGGIVIGTGDLSELALGWCTYNGDHMSMYAVNSSVPKTLVQHLVRYFMEEENDSETKAVLADVIDTPISPELLPADNQGYIAQKTEDLVGPYELHDFFLYNMLRHGFSPSKIFLLAVKAFNGRYEKAVIKKWLVTFYRRFFSQQFKRSCMPDGVKVGSLCLSPRGDWRMPSDASVALWLADAEAINID